MCKKYKLLSVFLMSMRRERECGGLTTEYFYWWWQIVYARQNDGRRDSTSSEEEREVTLHNTKILYVGKKGKSESGKNHNSQTYERERKVLQEDFTGENQHSSVWNILSFLPAEKSQILLRHVHIHTFTRSYTQPSAVAFSHSGLRYIAVHSIQTKTTTMLTTAFAASFYRT